MSGTIQSGVNKGKVVTPSRVTTAYDSGNSATDDNTTITEDWSLGNLKQVTCTIDMTGIVNIAGTDDDVVGFNGAGGDAEIMLLPTGTKILHIVPYVDQLSNAADDTYSVYAHTGTVAENAAAAGTELLDNIQADSAGSTGKKVSAVTGVHNHGLIYIFLVNNGANTPSGTTARTQGKIRLVMTLMTDSETV